MITLRNVTLRRGSNVLLHDVNLTIYPKQRIGLIGANGSGKSSLFSMLLNELSPDVGDFDLPRQIRISHVQQETPGYTESALDYVLDGDKELRHLENLLRQAEEKDDGEKIATLHEKLSIIDAYTAPARAGKLLNGLGFTAEEQTKSVNEFSGGWRMRLNLAKALMSPSDMLLLDEPTNHLDLDAVIWLENWLTEYHGTLILISHDRDFLDKTVDHIAHISHHQLKMYSGNYSGFEKLRAEELMHQQALYTKQQAQIAHMQKFVDRFRYKATKAKQAQSRLKAIARMELVSAVQTESDFQFEFRESSSCPNPLISLNDVSVGYEQHVVLQKINLSLSPKSRIGILGPNGAGKSTFIKLLAGELMPMQGEIARASGLRIGYFAQHQVDHLLLDESPLDHLRNIAKDVGELELRKFLGTFGFSGQRVLEPVQNFSGGEKSRLALALLVWLKPNLLLLDEPTNHLDMQMRNALNLALQQYDGAVLLVSHDRFLIRSTAEELFLIADGRVAIFDNDLESYQSWLLDFRKRQNVSTGKEKNVPTESKKVTRQKNANLRDTMRPIMMEIAKYEKDLTRLEKEATEVEMLLADSNVYEEENKEKLQRLLIQQAEIKKQQVKIEELWLKACDERDRLSE